MTAPVIPSAPGARTTSASGAASRSSTGPSPFASMLDDALSADRPAGRGPADRGVERRTSSDERDARAADRAADTADRAADRVADRADRAVDRAAHRAERAAAHAASRAGRAGDRPSGTSDVPEGDGPVGDAKTVVAPETPVSAAPEASTEPVPSGLPAAVWALLMGGPAVVPVQTEVAPGTTDATTAVAPVAAVAAASADPTDLPAGPPVVPAGAAAAETVAVPAAGPAAPP
ncbi:hypothetical protein, partial [Blastococcus sp. CT_GayMR16]|uniref:hypothetical protein n=1 Tax=Blastococcus sp. CT_GayMR16 TaxID=2559607 RepID=UPI00110396FE